MPTLLDRTRAALAAFRGQPGEAALAAPVQAWARRTVEKVRASAFAGRLQLLPFLDNQTEETEEIRKAYPAMLKEAVIKSGFLTKTLAVCAQDIQINPVDAEDQRQVEGADFVRYCLTRIKGGTLGLAWSVLAPALIRGWNVCEKTTQIEHAGRFVGKETPHLVKAKEHVQLEIDRFRNITGIRSTLDAKNWPVDKFITVSYLGLYDNPLGMSDFRAAYRPYWIKNTVWKLRGLHLEKYTSPYLKGTYADADQRAALEAALEAASASTWISVPVGTLVDVIDLSMKGTTDFQAAIQDCDREMLVGIVGAYLQILEGQVSNARGDTSVHKDTSELFQWLLSALLAQVLNEQLIPEWIEVNYTGLTPPVASLGSVSDAALVDSLKIDQGLQALGVKLSKKKVLAYYGRQEAADEADALVPPAAAGPPALPFAEDPNRPFVPSWAAPTVSP